MSMRTLLSSAVTVILLCPTLASAQTARRSTASDPDMKELSTYTLSMDALNKIDRVNKAMLANIQKDPKYAERVTLGKELAGLKKKSDTTEADDKRIEELEARIEKIDAANESHDSGDAATLTDMERKINAMPPMAAALRQEGVSAREYAKFTMAMMQAGFALAAKQMTAKSGKPFQTPEGVNPANIKFVEEHQADLKRMEDSYSQLSAIK